MEESLLAWIFLQELMNDSEEESSSDEEMVIIVSHPKERGETPMRIKDYVSRTIPNLTAVQFKKHFRLTITAFENILRVVGPNLKNMFSEGRPTIEPKHQLLSVIWLLATPDSYRSVSERFDLGKSSLFQCFGRVVPMLNKISPTVIRWPQAEYAAQVKQGFSRSGFTSCLGMIDGTYIHINAPNKNSEVYICRKKFHAITLQAICDHKLQFIDCFVGYPASVNDCRIFKNSNIYKNIINNPAHYFPNDEYIIGDKAYPLKKWCVRPYINRGNLLQIETHFNTQLSNVRQSIERSFSLLKGRFRRLKFLDMHRTDLIPATVLACCVLHNFCISDGDIDEELIAEGLNDENELANVAAANVMQVDEAGDDEAGILARDILARNIFMQRL